MAKDKEFEKNYLQVKLNRAIKRRKERNRNRIARKKIKGEICPHCYGIMSWCSCCEMWSSNCCETYGTCMCS